MYFPDTGISARVPILKARRSKSTVTYTKETSNSMFTPPIGKPMITRATRIMTRKDEPCIKNIFMKIQKRKIAAYKLLKYLNRGTRCKRKCYVPQIGRLHIFLVINHFFSSYQQFVLVFYQHPRFPIGKYRHPYVRHRRIDSSVHPRLYYNFD